MTYITEINIRKIKKKPKNPQYIILVNKLIILCIHVMEKNVNHFKDPLNETQIQSRATRTSKKIEVGAGA